MNDNILVIKMSPYNELTSSTLRTIAMIKGLIELGYSVDYLTIGETASTTLNDISQYSFMEKVNIIKANNNAVYNNIVRNSSGGVKKIIVGSLRTIYHKTNVFDNTKKIAQNIKLNILNENHYNYIISVSDPKTSHIAASNLISQGLKYDKWIEYWGDPLVGDITNEAIWPKCILKVYEKKLFSNCDKIVYTSPFTH